MCLTPLLLRHRLVRTRVSGVGSPPEAQAGQRLQRGELFAVVVVFDHGRQWRPGVVSLFAPPLICQPQTNTLRQGQPRHVLHSLKFYVVNCRATRSGMGKLRLGGQMRPLQHFNPDRPK